MFDATWCIAMFALSVAFLLIGAFYPKKNELTAYIFMGMSVAVMMYMVIATMP